MATSRVVGEIGQPVVPLDKSQKCSIWRAACTLAHSPYIKHTTKDPNTPGFIKLPNTTGTICFDTFVRKCTERALKREPRI